MPISATRIREILDDCLFLNEEITDLNHPIKPIEVEGIVNNFDFHPQRLESHRKELIDIMEQLPRLFFTEKEGGGDGYSFLGAFEDKDNNHWGEHHNMQELFCLLMGLKLAAYCAPREMWDILPGGMPYIVVGKNLPATRKSILKDVQDKLDETAGPRG